MPIYEYRCKECHQVFEEWVKQVDETEMHSCPVCDSFSERIISNTTFVLKGGGWYATDYGNKGKDSANEASPAEKPAVPDPASAPPATPVPAASQTSPVAPAAG